MSEREDDRPEHDRHADEPGAENEGSEAKDTLPGAPADKDAAAGDTDQHSDSNA
jgi:hypothetical protein